MAPSGLREPLLAPRPPPRTLSEVADISDLTSLPAQPQTETPERLFSYKPLLGLTSGALLALAVITLVSIAILAGEDTHDPPLCRKSTAMAVMGLQPGRNLSAQLVLWSGMGRHRKPLNDLHTFDLFDRSWEARSERRHAQQPLPRWKAGAVQAAGGMVIFGGDAFSSRGRSMYEADLWLLKHPSLVWRAAQVSNTTPTPTPRRAHSTIAYQDVTGGDRIVVFGGRQQDGRVINDVWEAGINWPNATWRQLHPGGGAAPAPRKGHTAVLLNDAESPQMLVYGGRDDSTYFSDLWLLDIQAREWRQLNPGVGVVPPPRDHHSAVYFRGKMFVYGGRSGTNYESSQPLDDLWAFNVRTLSWQQVPQAGLSPLPRFLNSWAQYTPPGSQDLRVVMFGGETLHNCFLNDVWELSLSSLLWTQLSPPEFCRRSCKQAFQW